MAYSDNIKRLVTSLCDQGRSAENVSALVSKQVGEEGYKFLEDLAVSLSIPFNKADWEELKEKIIDIKTIRRWHSKSEGDETYNLSGEDRRDSDYSKRQSQISGASSIGFDRMKHRNDLLEAVIPELKGISVFDARDIGLSIWYSRPHETRWRIAKGWVEKQKGGQVGIRLDVEEKLEFTYLRQHLKNDEIWTVIKTWKKVMAHDISTRLNLLSQIINKVRLGTGLPVLELGFAGEGVGIDIYYTFNIYDYIFSNAIGIRVFPQSRDQFAFDTPNTIRLGGQPVIRHPDSELRKKAIDFFLDAQTGLTGLSEVKKAIHSYENAQQTTGDVKKQVDRIRLAVAFPMASTCDGCR